MASCTGPAVASIVERKGILTVSRMSKNRVPPGRRSSKPAGSGRTSAVSPAHEPSTPALVDGLALSDGVLPIDEREVPAVPAEDHVGGAVACPDEIGLVAAGQPVGLRPTVDEVLAGSAVLGVLAGLARERVALPAAEHDLDVVGDVVVLVALAVVGQRVERHRHRVGAVLVGDGVRARLAAEQVGARSAVEPVVPASAAQDIGARPTAEAVSAVPADERRLAAEEEVVAGPALERVHAGTAGDHVVAGTCVQVVAAPGARQDVVVGASVQGVVARAAAQVVPAVGAGQAVVARCVLAADELVVSGPAVDRVVAAAAVEDVRRAGSP